MAWVIPKTNWTTNDGVLNTDMNRIEGNTQELYDLYSPLPGQISSQISTLQAAINAVQANLNTHTSNTTIHTTANERATWVTRGAACTFQYYQNSGLPTFTINGIACIFAGYVPPNWRVANSAHIWARQVGATNVVGLPASQLARLSTTAYFELWVPNTTNVFGYIYDG